MTLADPTIAASGFTVTGYVVIALALAVLLVLGVAGARPAGEAPATTRRWVLVTAVAAVIWLKGTWLLALSGVFHRWEWPPIPWVAFVASITALGVAIAFTPVGTRLVGGWSLAALVGVQAFRLPLELVMHRTADEGVMPVQMSYTGWNFDIVTGATAAVLGVALARWRVPRGLVLAWNVIGLVLLVNVVTIAILSMPVFRTFGDDRLATFVTYPPFVWLPAVMVLAAWAGHLLVFRKLFRKELPSR